MRSVLIWTLTALAVASAQKISTSGKCGADNRGLICSGSRFGDCCSQLSYTFRPATSTTDLSLLGTAGVALHLLTAVTDVSLSMALDVPMTPTTTAMMITIRMSRRMELVEVKPGGHVKIANTVIAAPS
jgi:hypothetical protein